MTYESWIKKALQQAGALHPGLAEPSVFPMQGAIYFVGCTINIVTGAQTGTELPTVPFGVGAQPSAMPAAVHAHQAE